MIISILCGFIIENYLHTEPKFFCFRYLFLSIPVLLYLKRVNISKLIFLIIISIAYLFIMHYSNLPEYANPLLPNGWEAQTSLGFFYALFLFILFTNCYEEIKTNRLTKFICYIGTISWEVFLIQMVLLGSGVVDFISKMFQSIFLQEPKINSKATET